jgi:hypothetical protein
VIAAGISVRYLPLGLPREVVTYAGSVLWEAMVYGLAPLARSWSAADSRLSRCIHTFSLLCLPDLDRAIRNGFARLALACVLPFARIDVEMQIN